ncbi:MAG: erythromycin esterase family protein [Rhodospirillaceae bacterium]|nr:erythromycin esterase family protein [Rhodospirillaceae bacterium]
MITNGWAVWGELHTLIHWMRSHNANCPPERKLRFYGMDGSGNWSHLRHVYDALLTYYRDVDEELATFLQNNLGTVAATTTMETRHLVEPDTWQAMIADAATLISLMEQHRPALLDHGGAERFDWAHRCALILRDQILNLAQTDPDFSIGFRSFWNIRDAAMADQMEWIMRREGPDARFVVGAHNTHLQQCPVRLQQATSMGSYLSSQIGRANTLFIGAANAQSARGEPPQDGSNQSSYARVGADSYFMDLRRAPQSGPVREWLDTSRADRSNLRYQPVAPGKAWDCIVFQQTQTIATVSLPQAWQVARGPADPARYDDYLGRYILSGFLSARTTLEIDREGDTLIADGLSDSSGELFPPFRVGLECSNDGRFLWPNWPAVLQFHGEGRAERVTLVMPGMGTYEGSRDDPDRTALS